MIGRTLAQRYTLLRLLGQGGMGTVYEAEQPEAPTRVAVKLLHSHLIEAGGIGPRAFRREAHAARAIGGEHLVRVLDAGTDGDTGHLYLVTELLHGEDLQRRLDRDGPLNPSAALRVAAQILTGLTGAHDKRVIHRDVKPANLFVAHHPASGRIILKILDFGIAKIRPDSLGAPLSTGSLAAFATTAGGILGSPLYMSPEQVQNSPDLDPRTDLWSLGAVLYAMLAGRAPHQHLGSMGKLLVGICTTPAPPLAEVAPWVPGDVADMVHRALAIRPEARYPSAAAMLDAIRRIEPDFTLAADMLGPTGAEAEPPRVTIAPSHAPLRGDEPTELRSAVPSSGLRPGARFVTVDPRRLLGARSELLTFSLDVHKDVSSLVARVYRALRRAGATLTPSSYGTTWILFDPRLERPIRDEPGESGTRLSLEAAGIRSGAVLWVTAPLVPPAC